MTAMTMVKDRMQAGLGSLFSGPGEINQTEFSNSKNDVPQSLDISAEDDSLPYSRFAEAEDRSYKASLDAANRRPCKPTFDTGWIPN